MNSVPNHTQSPAMFTAEWIDQQKENGDNNYALKSLPNSSYNLSTLRLPKDRTEQPRKEKIVAKKGKRIF